MVQPINYHGGHDYIYYHTWVGFLIVSESHVVYNQGGEKYRSQIFKEPWWYSKRMWAEERRV